MANASASLVDTPIAALNKFFSGIFAKIVVALIILLIGVILGKLIGRVVHKLLHEIELNALLKSAANVKVSAEELISNFVTYLIYFIALVMALNQVGLTTTILYIISGAVVVLVVISILLGIKDFIPNAIAGIYLHKKRSIKTGDKIKVRDLQGTVTKISLVETCIKTKQGDTIYIPNSLLTRSEIKIRH